MALLGTSHEVVIIKILKNTNLDLKKYRIDEMFVAINAKLMHKIMEFSYPSPLIDTNYGGTSLACWINYVLKNDNSSKAKLNAIWDNDRIDHHIQRQNPSVNIKNYKNYLI